MIWSWLRSLFCRTARASGWQQLYHGDLTGKAELFVADVKPHAMALDWEYVPVKLYIENSAEEPARVWIGSILYDVDAGGSVPTQAAYVCADVSADGARFAVESTGLVHLDLWTF
jgi:hypothetical protein